MLVPKPLLGGLGRAARVLLQPYDTPSHVQFVVTRRCNLSCGYCNEYDHVSKPVPLDELKTRLDKLADLGTLVLTLTGGEPLMHPQVDEVIRHAVKRGMVCTSITNGYCITEKRIEKLNHADLTLLQISIDNLEPNETSQKSWSVIKPRLQLLAKHATFPTNVNAVLGSCTADQTRLLVDEIQAMGFYMTIQMLHDGNGQLDPGLVGDELSELYEELQKKLHKSFFHQFGEGWEREMLRNGEAPWKCRAGSRYLYIDEDGYVNYCSQRRGEPGILLADYTRDDLRREFFSRKGCEAQCTIGCVRRASAVDEWRGYGKGTAGLSPRATVRPAAGGHGAPAATTPERERVAAAD
jgi:MoaA/NifB/PqqE/SkfB family radical SAM enzyme